MANVIKLKRGSGSDPAASDLVVGEIAIRSDTGKLFTKKDNGSVAEISGSGGGASNFLINTLSSSSGSGGGSASFNGTATRFTLSNPPSTAAQQLLVSVNGVIQKPNPGTSPSEGFAIDGNDIIFASAPLTGADFFIITYAELAVGVPSDNSVTSAKIADGAIVNGDVSSTAAIAGSKISPDFGSQNIVTTGSITGNDLEIDSGTLSVDASNNRVGIGTTSPNQNLSVVAANSATPRIGITNPDNDENFNISTYHDSNGIYVGIGANAKYDANGNLTVDTSTHKSAFIELDARNNGMLSFYTGGTGGSPSERMRIDSSGRVGINETALSSFNSIGDDLVISQASGSAGITIRSGATNTGVLAFTDGANTSFRGDLRYDHNGDYMRFSTDGNERMRIDSSGRVGIGLTPNSGQGVLQLNGGLRIAGSGSASDTSGPYIFRTSGADNMVFATSSTERMRIDSSGNVGIGNAIPGSFHSSGNNLVIGSGSGEEGMTFYTGNGSSGAINFADGTSGSQSYMGRILYRHSDNAMTFHTNTGTERMRIDSSGNLTFSMEAASGYPTQQIKWSNDSTTTNGFYIAQHSDRNGRIWHEQGLDLVFGTNNTERMAIDSSGIVTFGSHFESTVAKTELGTLSTSGGSLGFFFDLANGHGQQISTNNTGFRYQMRFYNPNGQVGYISTQNSATNYNTSGSDRTLKENFEDWNEDVLSLFKNINPQKFNFIADDEGAEKTKGFVAQDMVSSFPEAYTKGFEEDAKYMFNPSGMVVYLMKALKEAQAKIETMETKVAALEAK